MAKIYQMSSYKHNIKKCFDKIMEKNAVPDMSSYDEDVKELKQMSDEKFEKFAQDLKLLKNSTGRFPEIYCDYLIKQKLIPDSYLNRNFDKYSQILKRTIEDKTQHLLESSDIFSYIVFFTDELSEFNIGQTGDGFVCYNNNSIKNYLSNNNIELLKTIFHEYRHVLQRDHLLHGKNLSAKEYQMLKEKLVKEVNPEYYDKNYTYMYEEVDARIAGLRGTYKYLKKLGFKDKDILEIDGSNFFESYPKERRNEKSNYDSAKIKTKDGNNIVPFEMIFEDFIRENFDVLSQYPVLLLEFDEYGNRRLGFDILKDYAEELKVAKQNMKENGYSNIVILSSLLKQNTGYISDENAVRDSYSLLSYKPENHAVKKHRDYLIENELLNTLEVMSIVIENNQVTEIFKSNFYRLINNLNEFVRLNPDEQISKKILEQIEPLTRNLLLKETNAKDEVDILMKIDEEVKPQERKEGLAAITSMTQGKEENLIDDRKDVKSEEEIKDGKL